MRELYRRERVVGTVAARQLQACRDVLAEQMYCNRQHETVIRMLEIERAEQAKQIVHLQNKVGLLQDHVSRVESRNALLIEGLNRTMGDG